MVIVLHLLLVVASTLSGLPGMAAPAPVLADSGPRPAVHARVQVVCVRWQAIAFTYDAENRLLQVVSGTLTTQFTYGGDGKRVKKVDTSGTTIYAGNHYEVAISNFSENLEGDTSRWTTSGLWHITTQKANSPTHSAWYGQETTGNYATGGRTTGVLQVTLTGTLRSDSVLRFQYWREVESYGGAYDQTCVQLSTDGGASWSGYLFYRDSRNASERAWVSSGEINLASYAGAQNVLLRFYFDSVDGYANNYAGWFIDDVAITNLRQVTRYYYAGGQRVAMRTAAGVTYLLADHPSLRLRTGLGSTSVATDTWSTQRLLNTPAAKPMLIRVPFS